MVELHTAVGVLTRGRASTLVAAGGRRGATASVPRPTVVSSIWLRPRLPTGSAIVVVSAGSLRRAGRTPAAAVVCNPIVALEQVRTKRDATMRQYPRAI